MRLHCLGTTGYHPSATRHTACYYLPEHALLLDAGSGVFRLVEHLLADPKPTIDILLSHAHLDHTFGLTFFLDIVATTDLELIRLHGDPAKLTAVREHLFNQHLFPLLPPIEFVPLLASAGRKQVGGIEVSWFPLEHPGGSLGYVLHLPEGNLAYVTDTVARPAADYLEHLTDCRLLLHECYFDDSQRQLALKTGHSWLAAVTDVVEKVMPKQTLLIHTNPLAEQTGTQICLSQHHRETLKMDIAADGMCVDF